VILTTLYLAGARKRKGIEKERRKRAPNVSHNKWLNIFREEKNISTFNLFV
jgi:hypothetical protein